MFDYLSNLIMNTLIFRYFWLFLFVREYEQMPSYLTSCFKGSVMTELDRELITSPPDLPWQTNYNQQLVDKYPYEFQLGSQTIPRDYTLTVTPNFQEGTFDGRIIIVIEAIKKTKTIKLNSEKLDIKKVDVKTCTVPQREFDRVTFKLDVKKNFLIIKTSENLSVNSRYTVTVVFTGHLYLNNPFGFAIYETKYTTTLKDTYMAETLFDPFFARKAFPCYDELHYRTPFTIIAFLNENEAAVSSVRLSGDAPVNEKNRREKRSMIFLLSETIPINTIHYAFLGEEYVYESKKGKYFVWTIREFIGQVSYAVQDLENITEKFESSIFSIGLYLQRIDLVIPIQKQTQSGLLSYIKKNLLCDPKYCSEKYQERVTRNIVYHVSNKWFGQYVSIRSWNYFWLRDGFGTYYGFQLTEMVKSNWRMLDYHGSIVMQSILYDDRRSFFYPLTRPHILSKREIFETQYLQTDFEFYNGKASLIIRMLENIVGKSTFDKAIKLFLKNGHVNGGLITPDELLNAFIQQIEEDRIDLKLPQSKTLRDVIKPFTTQVGYPLLIVSETADKKINIEQVPYMKNYKKNSLHEMIETKYRVGKDQSWIVPITITTQTAANFENTRPVAWSIPDLQITLDTIINENEWYILNIKNTGYYRVNYPWENWMQLADQLKNDRNKIDALNRAQLIVDSHVLAADMKLSITVPITMTTYLTREDDPIVWMVALNSFKRFYAALTQDLRSSYKKFFVGCLKNEYRRIGFKINANDSHASKIWKNELLKFLCWIGENDCVRQAEKIFNENTNLADIEPNLQYVVFCTMLRGPDSAMVMSMLEKMAETNNNSCLRDLVQDVSICKFTSIGINNAYKSLLERTITGDDTVENTVKDILSNWDMLLPLLQVIEDEINEFKKTTLNGTGKLINEDRINGLSKFIENLKGQSFGLAEFIKFVDIWSNVKNLMKMFKNKKNNKYTPVKNALLNVAVTFKESIVDLRIHESLLESLLRTTSCDPKLSEETSISTIIDISEPLFSIFDIIRDIFTESEIVLSTENTEIHQIAITVEEVESKSENNAQTG